MNIRNMTKNTGQNLVYFDNLRYWRETAGLTMTALAQAAEVSRPFISGLEKHKAGTIPKVRSVANALLRFLNERRPDKATEFDPDSELTTASKYGNIVELVDQ